jgi:SAM-dependent methyltransferase
VIILKTPYLLCYNSITMPAYQDEATAIKYIDFLNSENGQIQQKILATAILGQLPKNRNAIILDAGCGPGWLANLLKKDFPGLEACDASPFFIKFAQSNYKDINFKVAELSQPLPYPKNHFDCVILNMVGPDLSNLALAFKNIASVLKSGSKLIMTAPNPKYTYPAAEWKRGLLGALLGQKPKLKIKNPPLSGKIIMREFGKKIQIASHYYTLDYYVQNANDGGLKLNNQLEIKSATDSGKFDLNYQLFRYPLLLLLEFEKLGQ